MSTQEGTGATPTLICTWNVPDYFTTGDLYVRVYAGVIGAASGSAAANPGSTQIDLTADQTATSLSSDTVVFAGVGPANVGSFTVSDTTLTWDPGRLFSLLITPTSGANNSWDFDIIFADNAGFNA
jgi:hypothetical protein